MLGMAGGDGSLAVVATVAAAHQIPFVCVPAGTRNHFALDLGVDRHDVTGALKAFTGGVERRIDVAEVNGRMFLNNVSLGIYGDAVSPAYRDAKVRTLLETAAEVLGPGAEAPALGLADDLGHEHRHPAVVLVQPCHQQAEDEPADVGEERDAAPVRLGVEQPEVGLDELVEEPQPQVDPGRDLDQEDREDPCGDPGAGVQDEVRAEHRGNGAAGTQLRHPWPVPEPASSGPAVTASRSDKRNMEPNGPVLLPAAEKAAVGSGPPTEEDV
jgi:hypothetical protein